MRLVNARLGKVFSLGSLVFLVAIAVVVLLAALVQAASAEELGQGRLRVKLTTSGSEILVMSWQGPVAAPMAAQISEAFEARKSHATRVVLILDSGGGSVAEGERVIDVLGRIKQTHQLMTAVDHGQKCGSMCVFIFVQGHERVGALTSAWLFHEVSRMDPNTKQITMLNRPRWEHLIDKYFAPPASRGLDRRHEAVHLRVGLLADGGRPHPIEFGHHQQVAGQPAPQVRRAPDRRPRRVAPLVSGQP